MDNNFNSNNQFEPEKPFTEKPTEPQPAPVFETENTENNAETTNEQSVTPQYRNFEPENRLKMDFLNLSNRKMTLLLKHRILNSRSKTDIIKTTAATDNTTQTLVSSIIRIRNINSRLIRNRLNISRTAIRRLAADLCISLSMDNTLIHNSNILNRTHHSINNISRSTDSRIINSQTLISSHTDSLMCRNKSRLLIIQIHTHNRQCRICHAKR